MRLLRIRAEDITNHWVFLRFAIEASFPPTSSPTDEVMNRVLQQALVGRLQVWVAHRSKEWPPQAFCILTTSIVTDAVTGTKSLLLFSIYAWDRITDSDWQEGFVVLCKFAKSEGCEAITFYTEYPQLLEVAKKYGFLTQYSFGVLSLVQ